MKDDFKMSSGFYPYLLRILFVGFAIVLYSYQYLNPMLFYVLMGIVLIIAFLITTTKIYVRENHFIVQTRLLFDLIKYESVYNFNDVEYVSFEDSEMDLDPVDLLPSFSGKRIEVHLSNGKEKKINIITLKSKEINNCLELINEKAR